MVHPAFKAASAELRRWAVEYALTPVSEQKVKPVEEPDAASDSTDEALRPSRSVAATRRRTNGSEFLVPARPPVDLAKGDEVAAWIEKHC
jgi:hypothetical protein